MDNLYPYQERVYNALWRGKNVILQAPTGGGKTRAALYPFLENLDRNGLHEKAARSAEAPLPLTCRYAVPMRVLASQFEQEYQQYITTLDTQHDLRLRERYTDALGAAVPAIQTGESPHDARFESPLTFCTIDQLLASFIGSPYSLGAGQANLNVGAVVGSYLVLDEFHLYPLEKGAGARATALAMLRLLSGLCRWVLMTATFSSGLLDDLGALLDAEVVRVTDDAELAAIMGDRSRTLRVSAQALSVEGILVAHAAACERQAGASLVVCNTVAQAQAIYAELRDTLAAQKGEQCVGASAQPTRLLLLHSRFTEADRRRKSHELEEWLGKEQWREGRYLGPSTLVVATQVVEVGLNISVGALHTELAPANSVIQRAGRCARFAGQRGEVIVYHQLAPQASQTAAASQQASLADFGALADDKPETLRAAEAAYLPYDRETCEATWRALLTRAAPEGTPPAPFDFAVEQALIDAVHTADDAAMIERFKQSEATTLRSIRRSLTTHENGATAELIRDVTNVSVIIHDHPETITVRPYEWEAFALRPGTLLGRWKELCARAAQAPDLGWVMKTMEPETSPRAEDDNSREPHYTWRAVSEEAHGAQIATAQRLALPSALATYDDELGFRLQVDVTPPTSGWNSQRHEQDRGRRGGFGGKQGSYVEHITGLLRAYNWSVSRELLWVAQRLEARLGLAAGSIDEAVRLAIACHDIGKLTVSWQAWAHGWQAKLEARYGAGYAVQAGREFLAKTDRLDDWKAERALQADLQNKRPPHACVGVEAAAYLIASRLLERQAPAADPTTLAGVSALALGVNSAIARHHTPTATEYADAAWNDDARLVIGQALEVCGVAPTAEQLALLDLVARSSGTLPDAHLITPSFERDAETGDTPALATWLGFVLVRALRLCDQRAERELG